MQTNFYGTAVYISIHAPARGATLGQQTADKVSLFQSTPPRGGRLYRPVQYPPCVYDFNPRPREGGDDILAPATESELHFNPRPREGGDGVVEHRFNLHNISIHAPARGATSIAGLLQRFFNISIHAPARGATFLMPFFLYLKIYFNPRPREGGDRICDFSQYPF